jgi:serine/threonine protein kinase
MGIIRSLGDVALKQVLGEGAEKVLTLVRGRFTDQGQRVLEALYKADQRAWQTLEIALAGTSWWDQAKKSLAPREDQAFARELQSFLDATPLGELAGKAQFRERCLGELQQARKWGIIPGGRLSAEDLGRQAQGWGRHADPQAVRAAEAAALAGIARELEQHSCPSLAWFIQQRHHGGPPLLALAVRYFFRREVEEDPELARGLTFQQLEELSAAQAEGWRQLHNALARHGRRVEELLDTLQDIKRGVLDLRAELQRLGQHLQAETRDLHQAVVKMLEERQLHARPVRPRDSLSIRTDQERALVKALLSRYRGLPEGQQRAAPALLNGLSQLELAVGDPEGAQRGFAAVARLTTDGRAQAEAHYNAYRAALARGRNDDALGELQQALARDAGLFAPFPLTEYELLRILGAGGFGVTFLCRNKLLGSKVAVKALAREDLERDVASVFQEAAALDQLHHPAIIQLRHCGYADDARTRPYVAMEYFEGQTLEQHVRAKGRLAWKDFKAVAQLMAGALEAAHNKGILHRDVKPANLLLRRADAGWEARLIDFGLALTQAALDAASTVKQACGMTGTLDYAAPEQLGKLPGVQVGPAADVYGFARTCCFALFETPQPGPRDWQKVSPSMRKLLDDCLAEKPAERLASFAEVLDRLRRVRQGGKDPVDEPPEPDPPPATLPPRLRVLRGLRREVEYPLHEGPNYVGRSDRSPMEVNLEGQEPPDRRQTALKHAVITCEGDTMTIEDLRSASGTFVNRARLPPGQKHPLQENDIIQIGSVQLQVKGGRG